MVVGLCVISFSLRFQCLWFSNHTVLVCLQEITVIKIVAYVVFCNFCSNWLHCSSVYVYVLLEFFVRYYNFLNAFGQLFGLRMKE